MAGRGEEEEEEVVINVDHNQEPSRESCYRATSAHQ